MIAYTLGSLLVWALGGLTTDRFRTRNLGFELLAHVSKLRNGIICLFYSRKLYYALLTHKEAALLIAYIRGSFAIHCLPPHWETALPVAFTLGSYNVDCVHWKKPIARLLARWEALLACASNGHLYYRWLTQWAAWEAS